MIQIIKKLRVLLDKKQKRTMVGLIILMVISAFLQTAGVGMLVEVMQIVIDPEAVQHSRVAEACYEIMGVENYRTFSIIVMVLLILIFVVKNLFTYFQQKLTLSFVYTNQFRTSERMMRNYLRRGYEFYLNADTAVVQRSITSDVNNMYALILALLQLLSDTVVSLFVISYCFISSGTMTILMAVVLLLLMWLIKRVLKPIMYKAGKDNQDYYSSLFKWISQTVQGIKEVKISGKEQYFVSEYRKCGKGYVDAVQRYSLYNQVPKLLIETACVATMVGYMIFLVATGVSTENMLTVFGTLAAAALVRKIAENYKLPYYTISPTYSVCKEHGYISGEHFTCPKCGKKAEVYSRITGYYRPVQNWNDGKAQEYKNRTLYDVMHSDIRKIQPVHASVVTVTKDDVKIEPVASHKYLFTTSTCPNCRVAKKILEGREFEIIDAEKNPEMVKEFGIMQAPTLVITDGEHMTKYVNTSNIKKYVDEGL